MSDVLVLEVPADATSKARLVTISPDHDTFVAMVKDANTETVFFVDGTAVAKVAANGKILASHEPNPRATQMIERFLPGFAKRDRIEGTAVFVGLNTDGGYCEVPSSVIEFATNLFVVEESDSL